MRTLLNFLFTENSWSFEYTENDILIKKVFDNIDDAENFSIESNFNLNLRGCPLC